LQSNQSSDSGSIDGLNLCQVKDDIHPSLVRSRAQNGSLITAYNSAQAAQSCDFTEPFDNYRQHAEILLEVAVRIGLL